MGGMGRINYFRAKCGNICIAVMITASSTSLRLPVFLWIWDFRGIRSNIVAIVNQQEATQVYLNTQRHGPAGHGEVSHVYPTCKTAPLRTKASAGKQARKQGQVVIEDGFEEVVGTSEKEEMLTELED